MGKLEKSRVHAGILHMLCAENLKIRRTWILWLHIVMPLTGLLVFLSYYSFSRWSDWGKISGYVEVVAVVCPTLVGFVCALSADQEKQAGHFQNFAGTGRYREKNLAVKLGSLLLWNLAAMVLAIGGFYVGFYLFVSKLYVPGLFYVKIILLMWVSQIFCYCFHLFLGLRFTKGITIGAGIVESLVSALMMTGMGEGIWQWIPCAWAGRFTGCYVQYTAGAGIRWERIQPQMTLGGGALLGMTLAALILMFLWFHYFEGNRSED